MDHTPQDRQIPADAAAHPGTLGSGAELLVISAEPSTGPSPELVASLVPRRARGGGVATLDENYRDRGFPTTGCLARGVDSPVDSPDVVIAKGLLDQAKLRGFEFRRVAPGEDGPLVGHRGSGDRVDIIHLAGFSRDCRTLTSRIWLTTPRRNARETHSSHE